jgi:isoleucyl-tRNA synthetase
VDPKRSVSEREREVLDFWKKRGIFKKSLQIRENAPRYSFYDGPPFATGTPHYGHLVGQLMKDVVPRYWTMRGKYVQRKWGWDCHGLPIENIVEKELGSKSKKDIESLGIEEFNKRCRANVLGYVKEWRNVVERFGRWADMDDAYRTMDPEYMESVWKVFADLWGRGLIYEGYRSMHICPRCETTLSQSEVSEGYKEVKDLSVVVKFALTDVSSLRGFAKQSQEMSQEGASSSKDRSCDDEKAYLLAWTTTPWTLLGNVALAVGEDMKYSVCNEKYTASEEIFIVSQDRADAILGEGQYEVLQTITGKDLIGLSYEPIFDFALKDAKLSNRENGWKVYGADFVTTEEGTGVVHIAPAFGEDDKRLGEKEKLPFVQHISNDGVVKDGYGEFSGLDVKPRAKDKPEEVREIDITILKKLKETGVYFSHEKYSHSYPHCWRCDTALLNYATSSWFVAVEKLKEQALGTAKNIHWVPEHLKEGRFGKWLEGARDWSISRQRFWASVMPMWKCAKCEEMRVVSSVMDIAEELGGVNRLYMIRHGEAKSNVEKYLDCDGDPDNTLTERGREQVREAAKELANKGIDVIIASPIPRAQETAEIIAGEIGVKVIEDDRLRETGFGTFEGKSIADFRKAYSCVSKQEENRDGVETFDSIVARCQSFVEEINTRYRAKTILVVGHMDSVLVLDAILRDKLDRPEDEMWHARNAEIRSVFSKSVDLHRPYIDEVVLKCKCGGEMRRIPDVLDTWFDSGSMPYAQMHYPFENEMKFATAFPANFIAEGVDQTRCWFYYLHILAAGLHNKHAFENVIVNGIVQAEDGKKMSKKLKNYPDPMDVIEKYGADVLRTYLLGSPVVMAENLNFSEKEMSELSRGMFRMLRNTYAFFVMYANVDGWNPSTTENKKQETRNKNILDRWILSEFHLLVKNVNEAMEAYELARAVRYFAPFVDDLSNWYVRRSRRRFWKSESDEDKQSAYETLYFILVEFSKLFAPFAPFFSEEMFRNLTRESGSEGKQEKRILESVHLQDYPQADERVIDEELMEKMRAVREVVSEGLEIRSREGIKVRQPLASLELKMKNEKLKREFEEIIKDELNVKEILAKKGEERAITLNTEITPELKREGQAREIVRIVQEMRKNAGYSVDDRIVLGYEGMEDVFEAFGESIIARETLAESVQKGGVSDGDAKKEIIMDNERLIICITKCV